MKAEGLNLIRLLGLAPPAFWVPIPRRRRLWGGETPTGWIGTNYRFFGGHNYGYLAPPQSQIEKALLGDLIDSPGLQGMAEGRRLKDEKTQKDLEFVTFVGFGFTAALTGGVAQITHGFSWLKFLATSVAFAEAQGLAISQVIPYTAKYYPKYLEKFKDVPGMGDMTEQFLKGETRLHAGSSGVVAFLAGFCLQRAGFLGFSGFWNKNWLAFYGGNYTLFNYVRMWLVDDPDSNTGHSIHFSGMAIGYWIAWYFDRFFR